MENTALVLADLDGTLFRNDKTISAYSKKIIKQIQEKGILFGISTSRALVNAVKFLDGISPDVFITNGGGLVTYQEKKIYDCKFSSEEIQKLIQSCFSVCGRDAVISVDNEQGLYSNSKEELGDKFWTYTDFSNFNQPCMKLCIKTLDKEKIHKIASSVGIDTVDFLHFSDIPWYKLSKKNATKEKAIEALCTYLKIPVSQVVAFGDDFNDIGMLTLCGTGVAMGNAIEEVKQIANEICSANEEDGLAHWLEEHIVKV